MCTAIAATTIVPAHALDPLRAATQYTLTTWGLESGLPQSTVTALTQTAEGFLWLGTQEGLVRFDGTNLVTYDRRSRVGLPHNFVSALTARARGGLWIGTYGGLASLDGEALVSVPLPTASTRVTSLVETRDGALWVATHDGVARLSGSGERQRFGKDEGLPSTTVLVLHEDRDGTLWAGTDAGLAVWMGDRFTVVLLPGDPRVLALDHALDGELWVGTASGVVRGHGERWSTVSGFEGGPVTAIRWDHDGNGWFAATGRGLLRLRGEQLQLYGMADGLPNDDVLTLFEDRDHILWMGSNGSGLARLEDPPIVPFGQREGLARDAVFAVLEAHDGSMWVGTNGGGLEHLVDGVIEHRTTEHGLASNFIAALHQTRDGTLWVGTKGRGLDRLLGGHVQHFGVEEGLAGSDVFAIAEDARDRVWVGTELGLFWRAPGEARFQRAEGVPVDVITALETDREGMLWVGTQVHGLLLVDGARIRSFGAAEGLPDPFVTTVQLASDGDLWVGTLRGLTQLHGGRLFSYGAAHGLDDQLILEVVDDQRGHLWLTSNRGLARLAIEELEAVATDPRGPDGQLRTISPMRFGVGDGMRSSECNGGFHPAGVLTRDRNLWFPTMRGLVEVDPLRLAKTQAVPPVVMGNVVADRVVVTQPGALLAPGTQDVELHYTGIGLGGDDDVRFRYRMVGFDREWIDAGARRVAYYTNLPPGSYRFEVVACNEAGACSPQPASWALGVEPHFYERRAFYVLVVLLTVGLVVGVYRLNVRRIRARARWLETTVAARTTELRHEVLVRQEAEVALIDAKERAEAARAVAEDARRVAEQSAKAKGEFLANMSHEIRTPMNAVLGMTDLALGTQLDEDQREMLTIARGAADGLLTIINDILDISKMESGMMVLSPLSFDLRHCLDDALSVVRFQAQTLGLDLSLTVADDVDPVLLGDPDRLRQVLLNLLSNAIKFTPQGGVAVRVSTVERQGAVRVLRFEVEDTGIGIPADRQAAIFEPFEQADGSSTRRFGGTGLGLSIAKRLVELMGGQLTVSSVVGQGSVFAFAVRLELGDAAAVAEPVRAVVVPAGQRASLAPRGSRASLGARAPGPSAQAAGPTLALVVTPAALEAAAPPAGVSSPSAGAGAVPVAGAPVGPSGAPVAVAPSLTVPVAPAGPSVPVAPVAVAVAPVGPSVPVPVPVAPVGPSVAVAPVAVAPSLVAPSLAVAPVGPVASPPAGRSLAVLLAEDNVINQKVAVRILEKQGHQVVVACNGREAVEASLARHFDVILMDVHMPEMDGITATRTIRERERSGGARIPIVALTAGALAEDREKCMEAGMDAYLTKPVRADGLSETLAATVPARAG